MCTQTATIVICLDSAAYGPGATSIDVSLSAPSSTSGIRRDYSTYLEYWVDSAKAWKVVQSRTGYFSYSVNNSFSLAGMQAGSYRVSVTYRMNGGGAITEYHPAVTVRR
ncbi:hypothetical protein D0U04_29920 [Bacillus clarus]|uniref:Uncharacterized protein n=1 Tax=Bacillus clarus TaxID=2338372 RepID=A0A090YBA2_9BACI|nr:hypothetical protein [Bacillus clarus]KFM95097.1 hypothetical protein DJ93_5682 [Bacillus clarus]RFT61742.1 hypothetical protein D0U04_29920 [Bacillus clarus]